MIQLESVKHIYGFDRGLRASLKNMSKVKISIPIDENGNIDAEKQKEVIDRYNAIQEIKKQVKEYREKIQEISIEIKDKTINYKKIKIIELFNIRQGNAFYTKKRILGNGWKGDIPVFSSNTQDNGLLMRMDISKIKPNDLFYQHCLTWSVDGYAGKLFIRNKDNVNNEKKKEYFFTINNHSGILLPKEEGLSLEYILFALQPYFFEKSKGYGNKKLGTNQIIDIKIPIPVKPSGKFDLEAQKEIADKYKKIEEIKKTIDIELKKIEETQTNYK